MKWGAWLRWFWRTRPTGDPEHDHDRYGLHEWYRKRTRRD